MGAQVVETTSDRRIKTGGYRVAHRLRASDTTISKYVAGVRRELKEELIERNGEITAYEWSQIDAVAWADSVLLQCARFLSQPDRTIFESPGQVWSIVNDTIPRYIGLRERALKNLGLDQPPQPVDIGEIIASVHAEHNEMILPQTKSNLAKQGSSGTDSEGCFTGSGVPKRDEDGPTKLPE